MSSAPSPSVTVGDTNERRRSDGFTDRRYAERVAAHDESDEGRTLLAISPDRLDVGRAYDWAVHPSCGAVVLFSGTARDHSEGRDGVSSLSYEAWEEAALPRMAAIVAEIRRRHPSVVRVALLHRTGEVPVGESSVVVVAGAPHRPEAFAAARFGIDALKATVPIWKRETWTDGTEWAGSAQQVADLRDFVEAQGAA